MRLVLIIPTIGRKSTLVRSLKHLEDQLRPPDLVLVSAPDASHVEPYASDKFALRYLFGRQGLCAQRNLGLEEALKTADIVSFFDDDFLPARDYLAVLEKAFEVEPTWSVIMGNVVLDGANGPGLSFDDGVAALKRAEAQPPGAASVIEHPGAYGCNMSIRARHVGSLRFDERLVLYGWQEDIDFTSQLRRSGQVMQLSTLVGVHLGAKSGRMSGVRFGYSQIVNPTYLMLKGTVPVLFGLRLMARNVVANCLRSLWPEPYVDRRGRLHGNILAATHVVRGRIEPEYVLKL
jgi:GT2 family glycosyltransferase